MSTVIIGGGVMGLTLAYRLSQAGKKVVVLESGPQLGGLSTWYDYGDFIWDKYYHVILRSDQYLLNLIDELGLSDQVFWAATKTGFLWKGKHHSMSNYLEFLRFPMINFFQKGRLGIGLLYSRYLQKQKHLESLNAPQWLQKVFGSAVYHAIWEPLLDSKFGVLKNEVPATIMWSIIDRYFSTRSKGDGQEWMGHLKKEGLKILLDTLAIKIWEKGGDFFCRTAVQKIDENYVYTQDQKYQYERVLSTIPTPMLQKIAPQTKELFQGEAKPKFLGVIRLALVLQKSLSPYYVTNLIDRGHPFTGIIEVSALADKDEMAGRKLVMLPRYDVPTSPWFEKSDEEITQTFITHLKPIWSDIDENILSTVVHRERIVQALWTTRPPDETEPISSKDGKIWCINAELAGRDTLNNNAIVRVANSASQKVLQ